MSILKLYHHDPKLALFGADPKTMLAENKNLLEGLTFCLQDATLKTEAMNAILALHHPEFIEQWGAEDEKMLAFWEISSLVLSSIGKQFIEMEEVRFLLSF